MRRLMFAAIGILFGTAAMACPVDPTLADLLVPGATFKVGDKTFSDFSFSPSGSTLPASAINVIPLTDDSLGIRFQAGFVAPSGVTNDILLAYNVTSSGAPITAVNLVGNPVAIGAGSVANITETVFSTTDPLHELGHTLVYAFGGGSTSTFGSVDLSTPFQSLHIQKDILLNGGSGFADFSVIDQRFTSAVPEPSGLIMCSLAGVIASGFYARRRAA